MAKGLRNDTATNEPPRAWQRMLSGRRLDLLDPSPLDVEIGDIAQHSLVVEEIVAHIDPAVDPRWRLAALLHDAPEYVIGDMISPFKAALGYDYRLFEDRLEAAIHVRFGLPAKVPAPIKALIKKADRACAFFEATQLAGFSGPESLKFFGRPPRGYTLVLDPLPAAAAQERYLARFDLLSHAAGLIPDAAAFSTE